MKDNVTIIPVRKKAGNRVKQRSGVQYIAVSVLTVMSRLEAMKQLSTTLTILS